MVALPCSDTLEPNPRYFRYLNDLMLVMVCEVMPLSTKISVISPHNSFCERSNPKGQVAMPLGRCGLSTSSASRIKTNHLAITRVSGVMSILEVLCARNNWEHGCDYLLVSGSWDRSTTVHRAPPWSLVRYHHARRACRPSGAHLGDEGRGVGRCWEITAAQLVVFPDS